MRTSSVSVEIPDEVADESPAKVAEFLRHDFEAEILPRWINEAAGKVCVHHPGRKAVTETIDGVPLCGECAEERDRPSTEESTND